MDIETGLSDREEVKIPPFPWDFVVIMLMVAVVAYAAGFFLDWLFT